MPVYPFPPPVTPVLREHSDFRMLQVKPVTPRLPRREIATKDRFVRPALAAEDLERNGVAVGDQLGADRQPRRGEHLCLDLESVIAKDGQTKRFVVCD